LLALGVRVAGRPRGRSRCLGRCRGRSARVRGRNSAAASLGVGRFGLGRATYRASHRQRASAGGVRHGPATPTRHSPRAAACRRARRQSAAVLLRGRRFRVLPRGPVGLQSRPTMRHSCLHGEYRRLGSDPAERAGMYRAILGVGLGLDEAGTIRSQVNRNGALGSAAFQEAMVIRSGHRIPLR
jgi:hypothetical protein